MHSFVVWSLREKKTPNIQEYKNIDFGLTIDIAQLAKNRNIQNNMAQKPLGNFINVEDCFE